jgi:hypothetical protein
MRSSSLSVCLRVLLVVHRNNPGTCTVEPGLFVNRFGRCIGVVQVTLHNLEQQRASLHCCKWQTAYTYQSSIRVLKNFLTPLFFPLFILKVLWKVDIHLMLVLRAWGPVTISSPTWFGPSVSKVHWTAKKIAKIGNTHIFFIFFIIPAIQSRRCSIELPFIRNWQNYHTI